MKILIALFIFIFFAFSNKIYGQSFFKYHNDTIKFDSNNYQQNLLYRNSTKYKTTIVYINSKTQNCEIFEYDLSNSFAKYNAKIKDNLIIENGKFYTSNFKGYSSYGSYNNGKLNGVILVYLNSKLYEVSNYKMGIYHGKYIKYYSNGKIEEVGKYEFGCKKGKWKYFNINGCILAEGRYNSKFYIDSSMYKLSKDSIIKLMMIQNKLFIDQTPEIIWLKNGIWKYYNINGTLVKKEKY